MLIHALTIFSLVMTITFSPLAWPYDAALADSYANLFAPVQGAGAGKGLHLIPTERCGRWSPNRSPAATRFSGAGDCPQPPVIRSSV
jgi:hypothetical protein